MRQVELSIPREFRKEEQSRPDDRKRRPAENPGATHMWECRCFWHPKQLVLPTWLLLAPLHPSCGETSSRKDTAPRTSCHFSRERWFIIPCSMRAHQLCKGSGLRACARPSLLWSFAWDGEGSGAQAHVHLWETNSCPHLLAWSITLWLVTWPWEAFIFSRYVRY